jgi:UPF0755 protein
MPDHLGLFDPHPEDDTGDVDLAELREALSRRAATQADRESEDDEHAVAGSDQRARSGPTTGESRQLTRVSERKQREIAQRRRHRRRVRSSIIALLVLVLIAGGVVAGVAIWRHQAPTVTDFAGTGDTMVVIRIQNGDDLTTIAQTLAGAGVVATPGAFLTVAQDNSAVKGLQPGYYQVRQHSSAAAALAELTDTNSRIGRLRLIPGGRLADVKAVATDGATKVIPGYITQIVNACVPTNGEAHCFTADQLWEVAKTEDPATLGVVSWAQDAVSKAPDPTKRLEGLILPGDYDIQPGSTALQALTAVVSGSAAQWNNTDVIGDAKSAGVTPYELTTVASLVQMEGLGNDMPKVARVIYNRLSIKKALQLDSTVSYAVGKASIATTAADRASTSPYNTYLKKGLPPTPIASPGPDALDAAANPADGEWLYFVVVDKNGTTCFSVTDTEHEACVQKARANGVFG